MPATDKPETEAKPSLFARLKIPIIVVTVMILELGVVYLCFPTKAAEKPNPEQEAAKELPPPEPEKAEDEEPAPTLDDKEIDLGDFSVSAHQTASNITLRVDFHLFATIPTADEAEFAKLMETKGKRVREGVIFTIRSADMTDLTDAGLGLLKRRILATTNRTLGKPFVRSVVFTDFRFNEQ